MYFFLPIESGERGEGDEAQDTTDGAPDFNGKSFAIQYLIYSLITLFMEAIWSLRSDFFELLSLCYYK